MAERSRTTVYLVVHEIFGIFSHDSQITLVTPHIPPEKTMRGHVYKIGRFMNSRWDSIVRMRHNAKYTIKGLANRVAPATDIPCHSIYSPHPKGRFQLKAGGHAYCRWDLPLPKKIHQLRILSIPDAGRPLFSGDPHGDAVDAQVAAISLVQAFEYELDNKKEFGIYDGPDKVKNLSYEPDDQTNSVNLHLWAQLEDETGMTDEMANLHAKMTTKCLVDLFDNLTLSGGKVSLSVDNAHTTQTSIPPEVKYAELMTLAEMFALSKKKPSPRFDCTHKTCGHGGTLYIDGNP